VDLSASTTLSSIRTAQHSLVAICRHEACRYSREVEIDRLMGRVGYRVKAVPDPGQKHFTDHMRCPSCKRMGMNLWLIPATSAEQRSEPANPNFRVIDRGENHPYTFEMVATANNLMVARGAYVAACLFYPRRWFSLMQGAFVVHDNRQDGPPKPMQPEDYKSMREAENDMSRRAYSRPQ
jgi:hypothetical protein